MAEMSCDWSAATAAPTSTVAESSRYRCGCDCFDRRWRTFAEKSTCQSENAEAFDEMVQVAAGYQ